MKQATLAFIPATKKSDLKNTFYEKSMRTLSSFKTYIKYNAFLSIHVDNDVDFKVSLRPNFQLSILMQTSRR